MEPSQVVEERSGSTAGAPASADAAPAPAEDMLVHANPEALGAVPAEAAAETDTVETPSATPAAGKAFDPLEALKLGSLRLATMLRREPKQQQQQQQQTEAPAEGIQHAEQGQSSEVVARIKATAAGFGARAKEQSSRFYQASIKTAASTAEGIKRLAQGEPIQALCRSEVLNRPCPQLVLACCTALTSGGGITTECIFKHNPPQELVDRLAATAAGPVSLLPPGASPHAVAGLLKQFLMGLPEPVLTYRLLPQWVAAGDHPETCVALLQQLPAANANTLRLLMQTCSFMNEHAAQNEMDSQALAEVLAPVLAWKPAPKPQATGQGPFQGLAKALTLNKASAAAAADVATAGGAAAPPDAVAAAVEAPDAAAARRLPSSTASGVLADAHRVTPLDDAELDAVVTVMEYMISHFNTVFEF